MILFLDNEGWNCLHASASCGYVEIAKFLVEANINICEVTADGELASDVCIEVCRFVWLILYRTIVQLVGTLKQVPYSCLKVET